MCSELRHLTLQRIHAYLQGVVTGRVQCSGDCVWGVCLAAGTCHFIGRLPEGMLANGELFCFTTVVQLILPSLRKLTMRELRCYPLAERLTRHLQTMACRLVTCLLAVCLEASPKLNLQCILFKLLGECRMFSGIPFANIIC